MITEDNAEDYHSSQPLDKAKNTLQASSQSTLQSKNIRIHKHRTSVRLEPEMWNALKEIATLERCSIHDLCGAVHDLKDPAASFTAALRVFMMEYYRSAAHANPRVMQIQKQAKEGRAADDRDMEKKMRGV